MIERILKEAHLIFPNADAQAHKVTLTHDLSGLILRVAYEGKVFGFLFKDDGNDIFGVALSIAYPKIVAEMKEVKARISGEVFFA